MDNFWVVTLFHFQPSALELASLENRAFEEFSSVGVEEFSLDEATVDGILGERSYSGGDLPETVISEVEDRILGAPNNYRFFFGDKKNAEEFFRLVNSELLCESQCEEKKTEDWNAEWKKHYAPILVNENFEIIPSWSRQYRPLAKDYLYLYPGMGFGTGSHETTFLCLRLFTEHLLQRPLAQVLDFGSGSGILGLSVLKFYPEARVDFYDIDPEANKNCFQNAEANGLETKAFRLLLPEFRNRLQPQYDLVFANILESILLQEQDELIRLTKPGAHLILSGLLRHQVPGIIGAYTSKGMRLVEHLDKGDWSALIFSKGLV